LGGTLGESKKISFEIYGVVKFKFVSSDLTFPSLTHGIHYKIIVSEAGKTFQFFWTKSKKNMEKLISSLLLKGKKSLKKNLSCRKGEF